MNYNPNIHKRKSIRLQEYDYSQSGLYFITICTSDRKCLFGQINEQKMVLNEGGDIAEKCWLQIPVHFPNALLHEYIVMPNHVHGIIELSTTRVEDIQPLQHTPKQNQFQKIIPHSIGSIVRGFKIGVTQWFRQNSDEHNIWQRNYYEHIIRNQESYQKISAYIVNNPGQWKEDKFYIV